MDTSNTVKKRHYYRAALQAVCYSTVLGVYTAHAGPTGGEVVGGSGAVTQSGLAATINQTSQNLAINWQTFNVNANERVQFIQPNATSIALNRILSNNGSVIAGRIDANGHVILANPNGVFFTPTASLNVGGIIASGLDIHPTDFMNGQYLFHDIPGTHGTVISSGMINASLGGNVALLGKHVENNGLIAATLGSVTLAAGKQAVLTFDNGGLLGVRVSEAMLQKDLGVDPAVINRGDIQAQGGRVLLTASVCKEVFSRAVNTQGIEPATSVVVNPDGSFTLGSGADVLNSGSIDTSTTTANQNVGRIVLLGENVTSSGALRADATNGNGGEIELHAKDTALLTQNSMTTARAETNGQGGTVKVLGDKVGVFDLSKVDVSGATGGGQALIGGDYQGSNPNIRNASKTIVAPDSTIYADALNQGNGGKVILWADGNTSFLGSIFSRGGAASGNGGLAETSGKATLLFDGLVDLTAPQGKTGMLLLDPTDLEIKINNPPSSPSTDITTDITFANSTNAVTPSSIRSVLGTSDLKLQAARDIIVTDAISAPTNTTTAHTLMLEAGDDIRVNNQINLGINHLTLIAGTAGCAPCGDTSTHTITVNNPIYTSGNLLFAAADNVNIYAAIGGTTAATQPTLLTVRAGNNITVDAINNNRTGAITTNGAVSLTAADASLTTTTPPLTVAPNANTTLTGNIAVYGNVTTNGADFTATTTAGYFDNWVSGFDINSGTGKVSITANGNETTVFSASTGAFLGKITANSLDVTTTTGQIVQITDSVGDATLNLDIANTATFNAGNNPIDLRNAANILDGPITFTTTGTTNNVSLYNSAATTTLGAINVGGAFALNTTRNLAVTSAPVTSTGNMTLTFGTQGGGYSFCYLSGSACADANTSTGPTLSSSGGNLTVVGGAGADTFNLAGLTLSAPTGSVTLNGAAGTDTVIGQNSPTAWNVTATNYGTLANTQGTVSFTGIENLTGGSGDDTFTVNPSASISPITLANLDTGRGTNVVTVNANGAVTGTVTTGSGTNTVTVNGAVGSILGNGNAGNGANTITVNAGGAVTGAITTGSGVDVFSIVGTVGGLLDGSMGADTLTVLTPGQTVKLGTAVLNQGYLNVDHVETITATGSGNTLLGQDSPTTLTTWNIDAPNHGTVTYTSDIATPVTFSGFDNLTGGTGADTFIMTTAGAAIGALDGGTGANTLQGRDTANTWAITNANQGTLSATATPNTPTATFKNTQNLLGGNASDAFTFNSVGSLSGWIDGGGGVGDTLSLTALGNDISVQWRDGATPTVNASAAVTVARVGTITANANTSNTLIGDNTLTTWTLDSANHGTINQTLTFGGFRNLTGGNLNDTFVMQPGGSVSGLIDGGGSVNTLDMAAMPVVSINLGSGIAGITRITQLIGNDTASTLTGDNTGDTWAITGNNSGSVAGVTFRGFNNLVGGSGQDTYTVTRNTGNTTYGTLTGTITDTAGGNQFTVDLTPIDALTGNGQVTYLGGALDSVNITGTAPVGWSGRYTPTVNGTNHDQIAYANTASTFAVNYQGIGTVTDTASVAHYRINGTSGNDTLTLDMKNSANTLKVNTALDVTYTNKQNVILDGNTGTDTLLQKSGTLLTLPSVTLANMENVNNGTALQTNLGTLSVIDSGPVTLTEQDTLTLGPITTTNLIDITAGGAVDSSSALASTAAFTLRSTGDIRLAGDPVSGNALSGPITLRQITRLADPTPTASPTNTVTLNNTGATELAGINARSLDVTSTGDIRDTGAITVASGITLNTPGKITLSHMDRIATGNFTAHQITLHTTNGIGSGDIYSTAPTVLTTTTSDLSVLNDSGKVLIANHGPVSASLITQGDIYFTNDGTLTVRQLNANGGNQMPAASLGGNIFLSVNGSAYGNPATDYRLTPDIVAQNFFGLLSGNPRDMGQAGRPMSVLVKNDFTLFAGNANIHYLFDARPAIRNINAVLFEYVDFKGINELLINVESLGEFDPAIFTAVRNYYYEDVAIKMPNDQILGDPNDGEGDDEDDDTKKRHRQLDQSGSTSSTPAASGNP